MHRFPYQINTVLIAEVLDRSSSDQQDIAGLYKQLTFAGEHDLCLF